MVVPPATEQDVESASDTPKDQDREPSEASFCCNDATLNTCKADILVLPKAIDLALSLIIVPAVGLRVPSS